MNELSVRLKTRRKELHLSQIALSERSGVAQQTISGLETGRSSPTEQTIKMLAKALDVPASYLLGEDFSAEKNTPSTTEDAQREWIINQIRDLSDSEFQRVADFLSGIKAAR